MSPERCRHCKWWSNVNSLIPLIFEGIVLFFFEGWIKLISLSQPLFGTCSCISRYMHRNVRINQWCTLNLTLCEVDLSFRCRRLGYFLLKMFLLPNSLQGHVVTAVVLSCGFAWLCLVSFGSNTRHFFQKFQKNSRQWHKSFIIKCKLHGPTSSMSWVVFFSMTLAISSQPYQSLHYIILQLHNMCDLFPYITLTLSVAVMVH